MNPGIYKFSAALVVLNVFVLVFFARTLGVQGFVFNSIFLIINSIATFSNFRFRKTRAMMQENAKLERRNQLIRSTIGE